VSDHGGAQSSGPSDDERDPDVVLVVPRHRQGLFLYIYHDPARFSGDSALVAEICDINRTPNAREGDHSVTEQLLLENRRFFTRGVY
jgi:hypothetical protein